VNFIATASDIVDGAVAVSCTPASGSVFPLGTTTVNCSATDAHGNRGTGSFIVNVVYKFAGFFQPVDNAPTINSVKAGSAIPVKFSLNGNQGLDIFAPGSPVVVTVGCSNSAPTDEIEQTVTAGGSSLAYDPTSGQYIYVWKTSAAWAGTCRQLVVRFKDGTDHIAYFKFK
jgi:hypothetical protein